MKLTIYHDGQYWIGVVEQIIDGKIRAIKHTFGAEPQDEEVLQFVNHHMLRLFSQTNAAVKAPRLITRKTNPKRLAREAAREVKSVGISTYAQQAIKAEFEQRKQIKKKLYKEQKELKKELKWQLKRQKAKAKKRGH